MTARALAAAAALVALTSGCGAVNRMMHDGVSDPITPEQSKEQVVAAAKEIVSTLGLRTIGPVFWRASCNDQGDPPFQGRVTIGYPLAADFEASDAEVAGFVRTLRNSGWTTDSDFATHATAVTKNGVTAVFAPQNAAQSTNGVDLYGECRDVTTTKDTKGATEDLDLG